MRVGLVATTRNSPSLPALRAGSVAGRLASLLAIPRAGSEHQSRAMRTECRRLFRLRGRIPALIARGPCSALRRHIPVLRTGPRAGWLAPPLDRAADARRLLRGPAPGARDLKHGRIELPRCVGLGRTPGIVQAAAILKLEGGVETEEVRRAYRAVRLRDRVGFVPSVGKGKAHPLRKRLHDLEGILGIIRGVVAA